MITVVLVDDQALVRAGLRALLEHDPDINVVGEADNGRNLDRPVQLDDLDGDAFVSEVPLCDIRVFRCDTQFRHPTV